MSPTTMSSCRSASRARLRTDDSPGTGVQSTVRDANPGKLFQISGTYTYDWEVNEADEVIVSLEWDDVGTGAAAQASGRFAAGTDDAFTASKILAYQYEPASTPGYVFQRQGQAEPSAPQQRGP